MNLETKAQEAVDFYNGRLKLERDLTDQLTAVKEERLQAYGKLQVLSELLTEQYATEAHAGDGEPDEPASLSEVHAVLEEPE